MSIPPQGAGPQAEGGRPQPHGNNQRAEDGGGPGPGGRRPHAEVRRRAAAHPAGEAERRVVVAEEGGRAVDAGAARREHRLGNANTECGIRSVPRFCQKFSWQFRWLVG